MDATRSVVTNLSPHINDELIFPILSFALLERVFFTESPTNKEPVKIELAIKVPNTRDMDNLQL